MKGTNVLMLPYNSADSTQLSRTILILLLNDVPFPSDFKANPVASLRNSFCTSVEY